MTSRKLYLLTQVSLSFRPGSQRLGAKAVDRMTRAESGEHPESKNEAPNGAK